MRLYVFCAWDVWLCPSSWSTTQITLKSYIWPTVFPSNRSQSCCATNRMKIHHQEGIPFAILCLDDATLMDVSCCHLVFVCLADRVSMPLICNASFPLCQTYRMVAECLVCCYGTLFVRAIDILGTRTDGAAIWTIVSRDEVIHTIYLVGMMALSYSRTILYHNSVRALNRSAEVILQLGTMHFAITMKGIHLTIIVEQNAQVINLTLQVMMLPRTLDVL